MEIKGVIAALFFLVQFSNLLLSQTNIDFLEIEIDSSDSSSYQESRTVDGVQTVYLIFTGQNYIFNEENEIGEFEIGQKQQEILSSYIFKNIDTLLIWGGNGEFDCYQFMQNSLSNINNLFIFANGSVVLKTNDIVNGNEVEKFSINNLKIEAYGVIIDLFLFDEIIDVKQLDISNGTSNYQLILENSTESIDEVWLNISVNSKSKWRRYKKQFGNSIFHKNGYRDEKPLIRKNSSLNFVNLQRESNWKKL